MATAILTLWSQYWESQASVPTHTEKKTKWQSRPQLISTKHPSNHDPVPGSCCGSLTAYKACIRQNLQSYFPSTFLISHKSIKVLTAICYAGLALSENIAQHTGARTEILAFSRHICLLSVCKECRLCMILGFLHSVYEVFALMGRYTALTGISSVTTNQCCITSQKSEVLKMWGLFT